MPTHNSQIERSISRLNETAYGVDRTNSDDFRRIISDQPGVADLATTFADDAGYDNGSDVASDKWAETVAAGVQFTPDFTFQDIGYFLKDALGQAAVSGSIVPYVHTFTPQSMNVSRQLPTRTYLEKVGGIHIRKASSIGCTQLTISGGKQGRLKVSAQYSGSGRYEDDPAGYTSPVVLQDREWAYSSQAFIRVYKGSQGANQEETATAVGTVSGAGDASVTVTAAGLAGSPIVLNVAVANSDTPSQWAEKVRTALRKHLVISQFFEVVGSGASIGLRARVRAANDGTMNIALATGTATGITAAPTSANTVAGVAGDYQVSKCELETWSLTIDNPLADDGYRACSDYVIPGKPSSGQIRSEMLVGQRKFTFTYGIRLESGDKLRQWMQAGEIVELDISIFGEDSKDSALFLKHTRAMIDSAQEVTDIGGGFVGINASLDLLSNSGAVPFTAVLQNDVPSYAT